MLMTISMLNDIDFLKAKLGKVDGFGETAEFLAKIIKAKEVKKEAEPAPAATADTAKETSEDDKAEAKPSSEAPAKDDDKK